MQHNVQAKAATSTLAEAQLVGWTFQEDEGRTHVIRWTPLMGIAPEFRQTVGQTERNTWWKCCHK